MSLIAPNALWAPDSNMLHTVAEQTRAPLLSRSGQPALSLTEFCRRFRLPLSEFLSSVGIGDARANLNNELPWLDATELEAWRALRWMDDVVLAAILADLVCDTGLSIADHEVLTHLTAVNSRTMPFTDLARSARWSTSRLSHQLARMAQRGVVERAADPGDKRASIVVLTELGVRAIRRAAPHHVRSVRHHVFDHLSARDTQQLAEVLQRILHPHIAASRS